MGVGGLKNSDLPVDNVESDDDFGALELCPDHHAEADGAAAGHDDDIVELKHLLIFALFFVFHLYCSQYFI